MKQSLDPNKDLDGEKEMAKNWIDHEQISRAPSALRERANRKWYAAVAQQWRTAGCAADGAPYVVRAILVRTRGLFFPLESSEVRKVAAAFPDTEHCPGARGLSEAEKTKLEVIAAPAAPQAPKP